MAPKLAVLAAAYCLATPGFAYEFENAVPLTIGLQMGATYGHGAHLRLKGHDVSLTLTLKNDTKTPQQAGFYAATPLFEYLGVGEEYADKTFANLKASMNGRPLQVSRHPRAYFLGQDITPILRKAGVDPIPSEQGDWKKKEKLPSLNGMRIADWQAQLTFGWNGKLAPESIATATVSYAALPRFGLETIESDHFTQLVQQHCGEPGEVRAFLANAAPDSTQVLAEVFELPLPLLKVQDTGVTIERPAKEWMGTRQVAALACGYDGALELPSAGVIRSANHAISILVVSLLADAPEEGQQ